MENIIGFINEKYNLTPSHVYHGDARLEDWPFVNNLAVIVSILFFYLIMVKHGPAFMKNREPFNVTFLLVIYNFVLVILSLYMTIESVILIMKTNHSILCHPVNTDTTGVGMRVFFILRKKNNQLTFLHVYHHTSMVLISWYVTKYLPGGEKLYSGSLNSLVHVFMYTYYGMSAMGEQVQKYLWWKRYITEFQMIQFVCINLRCIGTFFVAQCEYPKWVNAFVLVYSSSQLFLFLNFYLRAYKSKQSQSCDMKSSVRSKQE